MTCFLRFASAASVTSATSYACPRVGWCDTPWWHSQRAAPWTLRVASLWTAGIGDEPASGTSTAARCVEFTGQTITPRRTATIPLDPLGLRWNSYIHYFNFYLLYSKDGKTFGITWEHYEQQSLNREWDIEIIVRFYVLDGLCSRWRFQTAKICGNYISSTPWQLWKIYINIFTAV